MERKLTDKCKLLSFPAVISLVQLHSNTLSRIQSDLNFAQVTLTPYPVSSSGFLPIPILSFSHLGQFPKVTPKELFLPKEK